MFYSPKILTPVTDFCFLMVPHHKQYPHTSLCAQFELKLLDCLEAYGSIRAREKCADLMYDMHECNRGTFQILRSEAIRKERMRKYRLGELKTPFDEYPPLDSYLYL